MNTPRYLSQVPRVKKSREVFVGSVAVGGGNPIRLQSMTTSDTRDVEATVAQIMRLADEGCDIARVTVQGMKEAESCEKIKNTLVKKGYSIPLVADIHFFPPAALRAADFVDKVRINPGNFVDKRAQFKKIEYNEATYKSELEKIEEKFAPLVLKCKQLKRAMRIGTNHGSLSDRIMNYYGDTPRGMVESAFEFTRVARKYDYHDIIFSMKASNPLIMIEAYRLLVHEMELLGWDYPLHLGVTEAGEGEDGRIKSAIGIGSLLLEGIGDTIRVSLTEDPWFEIEPCRRLGRLSLSAADPIPSRSEQRLVAFHKDGSVVLTATASEIEEENCYQALGMKIQLGRPFTQQSSVDALVLQEQELTKLAEEKLALLERGGLKIIRKPLIASEDESQWDFLISQNPPVIFLRLQYNKIEKARRFFAYLQEMRKSIPVILHFVYEGEPEDILITSAAEFGLFLCNGWAEGILLESSALSLNKRRELSFAILQGCRMRNSKTEFISCPGCGRTLFHLQDVAAKIRERTGHLPGVKIAIMGCIVNGPGEMADADFGYVGSKPGKIDLYVGKECVERDLDREGAEEKLINLIKAKGRWVEPCL